MKDKLKTITTREYELYALGESGKVYRLIAKQQFHPDSNKAVIDENNQFVFHYSWEYVIDSPTI